MTNSMAPRQDKHCLNRDIMELPAPLPARTRFLPAGAATTQLVQAAAANHTEWFAAGALASGGEVCRINRVTWTATDRAVTIAFPRLSKATASQTLDAIVAECYRRKVQGASCWSLAPTRPADLGARVAARGFEWGWKPHWMALSLRDAPNDLSVPDGLSIAVDDENDWDVGDLPYYNRDGPAFLRVLARAHPRRMWHFAARLDGGIVGHSVLYLTTGRFGVAGIYNVGVVPSARNGGSVRRSRWFPAGSRGRSAATTRCSTPPQTHSISKLDSSRSATGRPGGCTRRRSPRLLRPRRRSPLPKPSGAVMWLHSTRLLPPASRRTLNTLMRLCQTA